MKRRNWKRTRTEKEEWEMKMVERKRWWPSKKLNFSHPVRSESQRKPKGPLKSSPWGGKVTCVMAMASMWRLMVQPMRGSGWKTRQLGWSCWICGVLGDVGWWNPFGSRRFQRLGWAISSKAHGLGRLQHSDGASYDGHWRASMKHGQGTPGRSRFGALGWLWFVVISMSFVFVCRVLWYFLFFRVSSKFRLVEVEK